MMTDRCALDKSPVNGDPNYDNRRYGSITDHDTVSVDCLPNGDIDSPNASPPYSVLKVRIVTSLITILYSTGSMTSLIAQYLLDRWTAEAGHNRSSHSNETSICYRNQSDPEFKTEDEIQARVSIATMYYYYASCVPALLSSVIFGALVDMVGRRPAVISSVFGNVCKTLIVVLIVKLDLDPNFFYLAFALDGIGGSYFVNLLSTFAIMADVNAQKGSRIFWISILNCLSIVTGAVTSIGQGYLIEYISYFSAGMSLLVPIALSLVFSIYLPETLPYSIRQRSFRKLGKYIRRMYSMYLEEGARKTRWPLIISLMIFFTSVLNSLILISTDTLYQRHEPFCWSPTKIGFYTAFRTGAVSFLALVFLWIHQKIGCASDEVMGMIGMLFMAASFVVEAFVKHTWQMYMVPIIAIPSANISGIIRGVMSCLAGPEKQGVLFSSIAVIEVLCQLASTTTYNKVYAATVDVMPGAVYLVMAGVSFITFLLFIPFFWFYEGPQHSYEIVVQADSDGAACPHTPEEEFS